MLTPFFSNFFFVFQSEVLRILRWLKSQFGLRRLWNLCILELDFVFAYPTPLKYTYLLLYVQVWCEWLCWRTPCTTCIPLRTYLRWASFQWGEIRFWIYANTCRPTSLLGELFRDLTVLLHRSFFPPTRPHGLPLLLFRGNCIELTPRLSAAE